MSATDLIAAVTRLAHAIERSNELEVAKAETAAGVEKLMNAVLGHLVPQPPAPEPEPQPPAWVRDALLSDGAKP